VRAEAQKVFFSYSRADAEFALQLATDLRSAGVNLWIDQLDIPAGAQWDNAVEEALKQCPCLLVILSPMSTASQNVMDEVSFAIERNKRILPVLYRNCDIPFRLKRLQYIDFSGDYNVARNKLIDALRAHSTDNSRGRLSTEPQSSGVALGSVSTGSDNVGQAAGLTTRKKDGKSLRRLSAWIGGIAVIIAAALSLPYLLGLVTDGNSHPPVPDSNLEQELLKANVILAEGDIGQVRGWLRDEPRYQALARSCLKALAGKRVSNPVPLDVVNGFYYGAFGFSSDDKLQPSDYNDIKKIKVAIFEAWKERNQGTTKTSFEEIIENVPPARER
jgi:TIR domain-containing protein